MGEAKKILGQIGLRSEWIFGSNLVSPLAVNRSFKPNSQLTRVTCRCVGSPQGLVKKGMWTPAEWALLNPPSKPAFELIPRPMVSQIKQSIDKAIPVLTPPTGVLEFKGDRFEVGELTSQFAESARLEAAINKNLKGLGYGM